MSNPNILILNSKSEESKLFERLCIRLGQVFPVASLDIAIMLIEKKDIHVVVVDYTLGHYSTLKGLFKPTTSIIITGSDIKTIKEISRTWPLIYYVDTQLVPIKNHLNNHFLHKIFLASEHALLKSKNNELENQIEQKKITLKEAFFEINEIKNIIKDNIVKEREKRVAVEASYIGYKKEKQRIEDILKKLYMANDVTNLLEIVTDIKEIVQAQGISIYILEENEALGKYLKPVVWNDAFLSHPEFTKHFVLFDSQDFAAFTARTAEEINSTDASSDNRLSRRYVDQLKYPLKNILCVPVMHDKEVIGVLEIYNKIEKTKSVKPGFTIDDLNILRKLSEHISIAITKLNLIQYDALTGLFRPDPFFEKVIQKLNLEMKRQREGSSYAMVMGDVDWFKYYNDRNGHEAGNNLLQDLASVLKFSIRDEDLLCRYGGEEFLFFLSGLNSKNEASSFTERIRKNVEDHHFEHQEFQPNNNLTMSFGLTFFPKERIKSWDTINKNKLKRLANEADIALALAKGKKTLGLKPKDIKNKISNKNKVCVFDKNRPKENKKPYLMKKFLDEFIHEQRKHKRFRTSTLLIYKRKDFKKITKITKTIDLSLGGTKIPTETKLDTKEPLDLILILEDTACQLKGDVVYSKKYEEEHVQYHTGIAFKELSDKNRKIMQNYFSILNSREKSLPH